MSHPRSSIYERKPFSRRVALAFIAVLPAILVILLSASTVSAAGAPAPLASADFHKCGSTLLCYYAQMHANIGANIIPPECDMLAICGYIKMHAKDNLIIEPPQCEILGPVCDYIKMHTNGAY